MRRFLRTFVLGIVMLFAFALPAAAESGATLVDTYATVTSGGDCMISTTVRLHLDSTMSNLTYPVPANATDITLNGSSARTSKSGSAIEVDISRLTMAGDVTFSLNYNIPKAVGPYFVQASAKDKPRPHKELVQLDLPLLSSFSMPVQELKFVVTMPENIVYRPVFTSIYQQAGIEASLKYEIDKAMLTGQSTTALNDHEAITMTMGIPRTQFPGVKINLREGNPEVIPMAICGGLGLLYWLLFLRALPLVRRRSVSAPEGITAGELGCQLTLAGADLTMMIFHWAQMGYILIQRDGGRVMVHKRMDMGNERSPFEIKVYKLLFANRRSVDATGSAYARLSRKVYAMVPGQRELHRHSFAHAKVFRLFGCGIHGFCGVCIAMNMTSSGFLQVMLSALLVVFGVVSAWQIHEMAYRTHLRGKTRVGIGFVCIAVWLLLGLLCGQWMIPLASVAAQFIIGYMAAYGGRRTEVGRLNAGQILGLRSYLKHISKDDIHRMMKTDPDYFFNMAPFALALGVIRPFAQSFGSAKMDQCPYLVTRVHGKRSAGEWAELIADTADLMDARFRRMEVERWIRPGSNP